MQTVYDEVLNNNWTNASFISASGGTITTVGDFKTHIFTSSANFVVSDGSGSLANVDYLVVAGGGSAGGYYAAGGAGGFRLSNSLNLPSPTTSPLAGSSIPVAVGTYAVVVGAGASAGPGSPGLGGYDGNTGNNSTFSTITSAGGGFGAASGPSVAGGSGGSGGSSGYYRPCAGQGQGNTPPVSPPQGNPAGRASYGTAGGGGGAGAAGTAGTCAGSSSCSPAGGPQVGGSGGVGSFIDDTFIGPTAPSYGTPGPTGSTRYFAGGGGGGACESGSTVGTGGAGGGGAGNRNSGLGPAAARNGTVNTGGGGGGSGGGLGGSGVVMIRYKFQ